MEGTNNKDDDFQDDLPPFDYLVDYISPPVRSEEIIQGILRKGHKMIIAGGSKAGKSVLLMELCVYIALGQPWLGFQCKQGKTLYINLEIDKNSSITRFFDIIEAMGVVGREVYNNIVL